MSGSSAALGGMVNKLKDSNLDLKAGSRNSGPYDDVNENALSSNEELKDQIEANQKTPATKPEGKTKGGIGNSQSKAAAPSKTTTAPTKKTTKKKKSMKDEFNIDWVIPEGKLKSHYLFMPDRAQM